MEKHADTSQQIIEVAKKLMFDRGYNAFSYADIAEQIGIRKASIHYHFPNKSDLVKSVVASYRFQVHCLLNRLDSSVSSPRQRLEQYVEVVGGAIQRQPQICLCALLAAELPTLPEDVRVEVQGYFRDLEVWLQQILKEGIATGELYVKGSLEAEAQLLLAGIHGAMLSARTFGDVAHFFSIVHQLLATCSPA